MQPLHPLVNCLKQLHMHRLSCSAFKSAAMSSMSFTLSVLPVTAALGSAVHLSALHDLLQLKLFPASCSQANVS